MNASERSIRFRSVFHPGLAIAVTGVMLATTVVADARQSGHRISLGQFSQDAARVASLKKGVEVMKARKPSDPKSWFFQAAIHGVSDDLVKQALSLDPDVAKVDQGKFWNQCPHSGQSSADFLIWHRAYIFYFERILQEAAGDSTLRLPYWAYSEKEKAFPPIFADPDPDPETGEPRNPLFETQREAAFMFGVYELSDPAVSIQTAMAEDRFFGALETQGFAGGVADSDAGTQGIVERRPHNLIHFAVGGAIGAAVGSMGDVVTAAFDPIFWVHHSNIDRLWSIWDCGLTRTWGSVPDAKWFAEKPWEFHDADGTVKGLSRLDYIKHSTLGVSYDTDVTGCKRLSETSPTPGINTKTAPSIQPFAVARRQEVGVSQQSLSLSATEPVTRSVAMSKDAVMGTPNVRAALGAPNVRRRLLLEVRGVAYESAPSVGYDVYVNLPKGATPDRSALGFVGTLALFGLQHEHQRKAASVQSFDITDVVLKQESEAQVTVTIVPFDLLTPRRKNAPTLRRSGSVSVNAIAVVVAEAAPAK